MASTFITPHKNSGDMEKLNYHITDNTGRKVEIKMTEEKTPSFETSLKKLSQGIYNLIITEEDKTSTVRFIKQ